MELWFEVNKNEERSSVLRKKIENIFCEVFARELPGIKLPELADELILLECGLDSMSFALLVVELEEQLGFDPFTLSKDAFYPKTFAEFVKFYECYEPK